MRAQQQMGSDERSLLARLWRSQRPNYWDCDGDGDRYSQIVRQYRSVPTQPDKRSSTKLNTFDSHLVLSRTQKRINSDNNSDNSYSLPCRQAAVTMPCLPLFQALLVFEGGGIGRLTTCSSIATRQINFHVLIHVSLYERSCCPR